MNRRAVSTELHLVARLLKGLSYLPSIVEQRDEIFRAIENRVDVPEGAKRVYESYLTYIVGTSNKCHFFAVYEVPASEPGGTPEYIGANAYGRIGGPYNAIEIARGGEHEVLAAVKAKERSKMNSGYRPDRHQGYVGAIAEAAVQEAVARLKQARGGSDFVPDDLEKALNAQAAFEVYSAYVYLSMVAWLDNAGFKGFAAYLGQQAGEEIEHAQKVFHFLVASGTTVKLAAIEAPPFDFKSPADVADRVLEHEQEVTKRWSDIAKLASKGVNPTVQALVQEFLTEQMDEEDAAATLASKVHLATEEGSLIALDHELGESGINNDQTGGD